MNVVEELKQVREWLSDESHWGKGSYENIESGATCLVGACMKIERIDGSFVPVAKALVPCIQNDVEDWHDKIVDFNDSPSTTHSDIMRVLDCAIEKEEKND